MRIEMMSKSTGVDIKWEHKGASVSLSADCEGVSCQDREVDKRSLAEALAFNIRMERLRCRWNQKGLALCDRRTRSRASQNPNG